MHSHSRKCIWKCRLWNCIHLVSASMCKISLVHNHVMKSLVLLILHTQQYDCYTLYWMKMDKKVCWYGWRWCCSISPDILLSWQHYITILKSQDIGFIDNEVCWLRAVVISCADCRWLCKSIITGRWKTRSMALLIYPLGKMPAISRTSFLKHF